MIKYIRKFPRRNSNDVMKIDTHNQKGNHMINGLSMRGVSKIINNKILTLLVAFSTVVPL